MPLSTTNASVSAADVKFLTDILLAANKDRAADAVLELVHHHRSEVQDMLATPRHLLLPARVLLLCTK